MRRRDTGYIGNRMQRAEMPGRRTRGRPRNRLMDVVRADMSTTGVMEVGAGDRARWKQMLCCGAPNRNSCEMKN